MKNEFTKPAPFNQVVIDMENLNSYKVDPSLSTEDYIYFKNINYADGFFNIKLNLSLFNLENYSYFPFHLEFKLSKNRSEIYKIDGKKDFYDITIHNVQVKNKTFKLQVISEIYFNSYQAGKGFDDRNLFGYFNEIQFDKSEYTIPPIYYKSPKPSYFNRLLAPISPCTNSIFVVGSYRSGTSILGWALGQHPNLLPLEETGWLPNMLYGMYSGFERAANADRSVTKELNLNFVEYIEHFGKSIEDYQRKIFIRHGLNINQQKLSQDFDIYNDHFDLLKTPMSPCQRLVDATPENSTIIELISRAFKDSKFVFILRNPTDVINSLINFDKGYTFESAARIWSSINQITYDYYFNNPERIILIDYAHLIEYPAHSLAKIYEFLDEPNLINAEDILSYKINSSDIKNKFDQDMHLEDMNLLNIAHKSMLAKVSPKNISWGKYNVGRVDEIYYEIINKFNLAIS
jgi:hypothetical protein